MKLIIGKGKVGFVGDMTELGIMQKSSIRLAARLNQKDLGEHELTINCFDHPVVEFEYDTNIFCVRYIRRVWSEIKDQIK